VPEGERLDYGSSRFLNLEQSGLAAAGASAFVLVAGGLGERLGYQGLLHSLECYCHDVPQTSIDGEVYPLPCADLLSLSAAAGRQAGITSTSCKQSTGDVLLSSND
jgi:UDP-sugar pyrophosphorylase